MSKPTIATIAVLIVIFILGYIFWGNLFPTKQVVDEPIENIDSTPSRTMAIKDYVRLNVSELSPIKESFGGKFYVTDIKTENGAGTVSYEDGHNAYTADFTYLIHERGVISIPSWDIR